MRTRLTAMLVFAVTCPVLAGAQDVRTVTTADYSRAEQFLARNTFPLVTGNPGRVNWRADGTAWYQVTTASGREFILVDPAAGTRSVAFDHGRLARVLSEASGLGIEETRSFRGFSVSADSYELVARISGDSWRCDLAEYTCETTSAEDDGARHDPPRNSVVSPDGSTAVFIREHNLWAIDLESGEEGQLTTDGIEDFGYGTNNAGWVRRDSPVVTWSPDSRRIATFQHDGRGVSMQYLVRTKVGEPELDAWRYPLPGDSVIFRIHRVVIDLGPPGAPQVVRLQMPPDAHRSTVSDHAACGTRVCDLKWFPDGSAFAFISSSRDHKHAWMRVADAETGEVRTLFEETSETQVGDASATENWRVLPSSDELIWWSERDNWIHLYLYDLTSGELKNRITTGDGNVASILRVDEEARTLHFLGQGIEDDRDPYFRHLYRINFDGSGLQLLTPEAANHSVSLSPDGTAFIDSYSTPYTPPVTVLRGGDGEMLAELQRADISRLEETGWQPPTPVTMKGRDGTTDIYGLMFTPTSLDSTAKYPIVNYIYPGPQSGSVGSRSFRPSRGDHQALAELGFIVVAIDGMGTPGRSKAFHDAYYGEMADNTLPDQVTGIQQLAERYSWIDLEHVGVWGHSGGGFATAQAMFRYPDFYKVGIAESGNHDNRNYEDDWGERYQGMLEREGGSDNYAAQANQMTASNLKGKLMLVHGGMDSNVPPSNTYLVVDELIKANKDFDLIMFPNAGHGYGAMSNYMTRRRWDYFVRYLLEAEPPENYEIGRPVS